MLMKKVTFITQGCRLNQSESASLENAFKDEGYQLVSSYDLADIAVINTCTVTENGDKDTRRLVNKLNKANEAIKIALIGCQSQVHKEALLKLQNVQWVIGNAEKMNTHHIITQTADLAERVVKTDKMNRDPFTVPRSSIDTHHTRANIKIQDGCDFYCSFCVIPFARGPARSRVYEDIIRECIDLGDAGHQEIVITGINVGTYDYEGKRICDVINGISKIDTIKRIRISSIEPTTIPKELISMMNTNPKLCRYLHIPVQSGSDAVLRDMARKYTMAEFRAFVEWAYQEVPDICIGTDVIVGFPTETKAHFDETVANLLTLPIHYLHVFSYSERKFARSTRKQEKVNPQIIAERSKILRSISDKKRSQYYDSFSGKKVSVLFESEKNGHWSGLTDNFIKVNYASNQNLKNIFKDIIL
ncbi:tRNA (N(6)-L-threonylcarbamoyladenosine(37)-C(2))-methylthiotransferase MtaB [Candidatus Marinamargulisbacteria bacterium SCGC AG-414-C22]|nr:tRNA (N(6)-L-threonylcarbamoyladenosine(37)-C(2))-methylthiotransferase MtaB [Candidatus Marinamargulisbacteria bacterium SCGC AG-414-C22]